MAVPRADQVLAYLEARRQEIIDFTAALVATPSMNPPGNERAVADLLQERAACLGLPPAEVISAEPHRPNLLFRLRGQTGRPVLLMNGHMDTKPVTAADRPLWETDPLQPIVRDGRLYGLGSTDMKGGLAAITYAAGALAAVTPPLAGDLLLAFVADEEATTRLGASYLVDHHPITADDGLIAEPNGIQQEFEFLPLICRGSAFFKVKVFGTQTHASISDQVPAVNASVKMAWVLWRLARDLELEYEPHPLAPGGPTVTPGVLVSGGINFGVHPGYAEFATDVRIPPGMTPEGVADQVRTFLDTLEAEDPELKTEVELVGGSPAYEVDSERPFVRALLDAGEHVLGRRLPFGVFPAYTDGHQFARRGVTTVPAFGPGLLTLAHGPNEWVSVEGIMQATQFYALATLAYLGSSVATPDTGAAENR
ncbi:MAG: M20 family metallopeptidase [Chloroflexi bacterium]|nr:M20 family metallopeptidase [Chloroflexota bacterium]